jgi:pimeloyl-ACP methyl ester carboxylesterase
LFNCHIFNLKFVANAQINVLRLLLDFRFLCKIKFLIMALLIVLIVFVFFTVILILFMSAMFRNKVEKHKSIPSDYGIEFKEVRFPSKNNCSLYGWWIPSKSSLPANSKTILLVHGWNRNLGRMMPYIKQLHPEGYNLFVFDARNHGSSDTDGLSSMPKFAEDIDAALEYLEETLTGKGSKIGVIGISMGGSAAIYAASSDKRIRRIATVGAFAHPADVMKLEMKKRHIPYFPFVWLFLKVAEFKIGFRFNDIAPVNNIHKADAKILLIHGKLDETTPFEHAERLMKAGNAEKTELFPVPDKGHSDCHDSAGFWEKLKDWFIAGI